MPRAPGYNDADYLDWDEQIDLQAIVQLREDSGRGMAQSFGVMRRQFLPPYRRPVPDRPASVEQHRVQNCVQLIARPAACLSAVDKHQGFCARTRDLDGNFDGQRRTGCI